MSLPLIEIVTPAPPGSLHGNRITALRWANFLDEIGYATQITSKWSGQRVDCLIALHANRSHSSIQCLKTEFPDVPIVLMMTGTDLYRDFDQFPEVIQSMQLADAIVVLQGDAFTIVPKIFHQKTRVIYQSVKPFKRKTISKTKFLVSLIGHLRPEKDPFLLVKAIHDLPSASKIQVLHLGKAMEQEMAEQAQFFNQHEPRYHWYGEVSHTKTLNFLSRSHLMVISSVMEGGAHVVSEAIAGGIPVIASDISGNRGLLGEDYSGYFPVGDSLALRKLLLQVESNPVLYQQLEKEIASLKYLIYPETEITSISELLKEVLVSF